MQLRQKRRVLIAAVAASNPEVLLLDEPTVGQDYAGLKGSKLGDSQKSARY